jgi:WXG100 family type VII secretion target
MIKMRHGEVEDVKRIIDNDEVELDDEIKKMEEQKEILKRIWQGQDADLFIKNFDDYLTKMKGVPVALRNISGFMKKANGDFKDKDDEFSKELEKEANNYDEDDTEETLDMKNVSSAFTIKEKG